VEEVTNAGLWSPRSANKLARGDMRSTNRRLVLQHLVDDSPLSRAELARRTGLTPATVSGLVADLEATGLISIDDTASHLPRVGKPPTLLKIRPEAFSVIAVDLADPVVIRVVVLDLVGTIVADLSEPIGNMVGDDVVRAVVGIIQQAVETAPNPVLGIGVGTPGVVTDDGVVVEAGQFEWKDLELRAQMTASLGFPVHLINDANAAAIAEFTRGAHDSNDLAVVTIGSGVGAGFVVNGQPFLGSHRAAGEIGHLVVEPGGPLCDCGHRGCLETFVALPRLEAALRDADDDGMGVGVRRAAAERLGVALASIVAIMDLDLVLISGPRSLLGDGFCEAAAVSLERRCLVAVASSVSVQFTTLGADNVILGAAGLVMNRELGVG
jgi:predicted NBD/HSP70 family sugar kinase